MMGAGGFIKNPGWEILSTDDIMEDDYEAVVATFLNDGNDFELNSEVILFLPPTDEEMEEEEFDLDDVEDDDNDDENYIPSSDEEDFADLDIGAMSSDESSLELDNYF